MALPHSSHHDFGVSQKYNLMKSLFTYLSIALLLSAFQADSFKKDQLRYSRVRTAYAEKEADVLSLLAAQQIETQSLEIYLRSFKEEMELEVWAKNTGDKSFKLLKTFEICESSGNIGPKRKQGDYQVPEGFYHIDRFNPVSNFYLSLGINYPNKSDRILGNSAKLGGDIFIHGSCVTIGCIPITDEQIKQLYVLCVEAKNAGQTTIPVTIFPAKLSNVTYKKLLDEYSYDSDKVGLWTDLKKGYDHFNEHKTLPNIHFLSNGRHSIQ
jgi:murein L,D-transpeptidase YafK